MVIHEPDIFAQMQEVMVIHEPDIFAQMHTYEYSTPATIINLLDDLGPEYCDGL
jgi:hypothetical protein